MLAFAANSILNRAALAGGGIGALEFAAIRVASGALCLAVLVAVRGRGLALLAPGRAVGVLSLLAYMLGFSLAYLALDAGVGALALFGAVQLTMFAGALAGGDRPPPRHWLGAALALAGLAWLFWPGAAAPVPLWPVLAMAGAGASWGVYSLAGRRGADPLGGTAANFILAAPPALIVAALYGPALPDWRGVVLAVISGAVTSALGYALWYAILPRLAPSVAAVAQLTVPIIAIAGGIALLGEALTARFAVAAAMVLAGVWLTVAPPRRRAQSTSRSSGS